MNDKRRDRRSLLLSGLALGAAARIGLRDRPAFAAPAEPAPLRVRVTLDGKSYQFDEPMGRDLGDHKGQGFVQRCVMVTVPELPLSVFMRPDRDSDRVEVVFELGRVWSGPPQHLGPYSVEIEREGKLLARVDVPIHYWFSRWRWQSARRPVVAKAADLIAAGMLPPYAAEHVAAVPPEHAANAPSAKSEAIASAPASPSRLPAPSVVARALRRGPDGQVEAAAAPSAPAPPAARAAATQAPMPAGRERTYTIMGLAGLTAYMPTTGDRPDIGPVTEPQARWICTGASDALEDMFAQAEASGTVPWNIRDEKTGAPFSFEQYPKGGWNLDAPREFDPYVAPLKSPVTPDWAHHPALTYVPFMLTGDPYYLEALQLQLTWCIGGIPAEYRSAEKCILPKGQTRAYAWCLRDAAQLAKVTPEMVPGWLLPRGYWERILENNRVWFEETFVRNPEPPFRVFRAATKIRDGADDAGPIGQFKVPRVDPFEEDYLAFVMAWTVLMFPAWRDAFVWKVGATIARTDGKSGWMRAYATPYLFALSGPPPAPWAQTWKEAFEINAKLQDWTVTDPDRFAGRNTGYLHYARAALALATRLGVPEARECYAWADKVIRTSPQMAAMYRWSIPV